MAFNDRQPSYQQLRKICSERRREVVFWVGAGLSVPAGMPSWTGLRNGLVEKANDHLTSLGEDEEKPLRNALRKALAEGNNWTTMSVLKKILTTPTFSSLINNVFEKAPNTTPPTLYERLWQLDGVKGVITLNLDKFARRAHSAVAPGRDIADFTGNNVGQYTTVLSRAAPFVANLHGVYDNQDSWVLTEEVLNTRRADEAYRNFVNVIFSRYVVVFLGISAEDTAVGGFLESLRNASISLGDHFWVTPRTARETRAWAENAGLQVIVYEPVVREGEEPNHTPPLISFFEGISNFKSFDEHAPPIQSKEVTAIVELLPPDKLRGKTENELRRCLSAYAKTILDRNGNNTKSEEYVRFLGDYSPHIHQAWHFTERNPYNKFYGYTVTHRISDKPFSNVWKLRDEHNREYALKVLNISNLSKGQQIESFRRGVQSLEYLNKGQLPGAVAFIDAHEIPCAVLMDFVGGSNLSDIIEARQCEFWDDGIFIIREVCKHLVRSHTLPEGVLHRDIRPSNIMVPHFYYSEEPEDKHKVVLLNYDMSWHKNARGETISGDPHESGYYAPEQLDDFGGERARSTLVDSYGVGMTMYFAFTGQPPPVAGSKSVEWGTCLNSMRTSRSVGWRSASNRVRRLIERSTTIEAGKRPPMTDIVAELDQIIDAIEEKWGGLTPSFWAEEIFSRAFSDEYTLSETDERFVHQHIAGRTVGIRGNLAHEKVVVRFECVAGAATKRSDAKRWIEALTKAKDILRSGGWTVKDTSRYSQGNLVLEADANVDTVRAQLPRLSESLSRGWEAVRLD